MARSLREYIKSGLIITEGLAYRGEDIKDIDIKSLRTGLERAFRHSPPWKWEHAPVYPSNVTSARGARYDAFSGEKKVTLSKLRDEEREWFQLEVIENGRSQILRSDDGRYGEYVTRLYEHVDRFFNSLGPNTGKNQKIQ